MFCPASEPSPHVAKAGRDPVIATISSCDSDLCLHVTCFITELDLARLDPDCNNSGLPWIAQWTGQLLPTPSTTALPARAVRSGRMKHLLGEVLRSASTVRAGAFFAWPSTAQITLAQNSATSVQFLPGLDEALLGKRSPCRCHGQAEKCLGFTRTFEF